MRISQVVLLVALLHAAVAEARFGKGGSGSSGSGGAQATHAAVPVDSSGSSSSSSSSSSSTSSTSFSGGRFTSSVFDPTRRLGYFSGAFVPMYGYGAYPSVDQGDDELALSTGVRATAGLEAMYFTNQNRGYSVGLVASLEIGPIGVSVAANHLSVAADDGSNGDDTIQQLSARVSYAFLVGSRGRVRAELGADTFFAADVTLLGPTAGFSGTFWVFGSFALEGSVMGSVYPFWQLDGRAGIVIGLGALGIRAGFRAQLLDDQGVVDGVAHRDVFMGPYAGLGFTF